MVKDFIAKIEIYKARNVENITINLSKEERKHLILTGKNGSGKTSVLEAIKERALEGQRDSSDGVWSSRVRDENLRSELFGYRLNSDLAAELYFAPGDSGDSDDSEDEDDAEYFDFTFVHIPAKRNELTLPGSIEHIEIEGKTVVNRNASRDCLKYILYLDYQLYAAKSNNNEGQEKILQRWFDNFQNGLRQIYKCNELTLTRDAKNLSFIINMPGYKPFALHQMADGYAALFEIYIEILMRFDNGKGIVDYNHSAIALVDEIETHLHVELQKEVLPFLTTLFPNVQFIVSTHSPFVISSLNNAVVFDLETKQQLENPSLYSYEAIVESYLDVGQYSHEIKNKFKRYRQLYSQARSDAEENEFQKIIAELELVPPASKELYLAFHGMEDKRIK